MENLTLIIETEAIGKHYQVFFDHEAYERDEDEVIVKAEDGTETRLNDLDDEVFQEITDAIFETAKEVDLCWFKATSNEKSGWVIVAVLDLFYLYSDIVYSKYGQDTITTKYVPGITLDQAKEDIERFTGYTLTKEEPIYEAGLEKLFDINVQDMIYQVYFDRSGYESGDDEIVVVNEYGNTARLNNTDDWVYSAVTDKLFREGDETDSQWFKASRGDKTGEVFIIITDTFFAFSDVMVGTRDYEIIDTKYIPSATMEQAKEYIKRFTDIRFFDEDV